MVKSGNSPIVTSGGRGNAEDEGVEVELPKPGLFDPVDPLKLGSLLLGGSRSLSIGRLLVEETHDDQLELGVSGSAGESSDALDPSPWDLEHRE